MTLTYTIFGDLLYGNPHISQVSLGVYPHPAGIHPLENPHDFKPY